MANRTSDVDRFWAKVMFEPMSGCWLWTGGLTDRGYPVHWVNNDGRKDSKDVRAHRYAYELAIGPIPAELEQDHLCRNRACVNPLHLEPVTHAVNIGRKPVTTHCKHGHEYTEVNILVNRLGRKVCRACKAVRDLEYRRSKARV